MQKRFAVTAAVLVFLFSETGVLLAEFNFEETRKKADAGDAEAQFQLGRAYANGQGIPRNDALALEFYTKAAEQGNFKAQNNLGTFYLNGTGVKKDEAQAVAWYRTAAEQGSPIAQDNLALLLESGKGIPRDVPGAFSWFRKAAEANLPSAQYHLGKLYFTGGDGVKIDYHEAASWLKKAAAQNVVAANTLLGFIDERGLDGPVNVEAAAASFRIAAEGNDAAGQFNLGRFYVMGRGVKKDLPAAWQWLTLSANQGNLMALKMREELERGIISQEEIREGNRLVAGYRAARKMPGNEVPETAGK